MTGKGNSNSLAYTLGVLMGDGSVSKGKNGRYLIQLNVKDEDFADTFMSSLEAIGLNPSKYCYKRRKHFYIRAYSKLFHDWYKSLSYHRIENFISSDNLAIPFLKGFFDSEGCIAKAKILCANNKNWELLSIIKKLLERLGIQSRINKTRDLWTLTLPRESSIKFREIIGISIKRKAKALAELQLSTPIERTKDGRIAKGNIPYNKELPLSNVIKRKLSEKLKGHPPNITSFKKGHTPWNKKEKILITCRVCGSYFEVPPCRANRAKYCCDECRIEGLRERL